MYIDTKHVHTCGSLSAHLIVLFCRTLGDRSPTRKSSSPVTGWKLSIQRKIKTPDEGISERGKKSKRTDPQYIENEERN